MDAEFLNTIFHTKIFPAFLSRLKKEKTRNVYRRVLEHMEQLCGKPFLLLGSEDGFFFAEILKSEFSVSTAYTRLGMIQSISRYVEKNTSLFFENTDFEYYSPFGQIRKNFSHSDFVDSSSIPEPEEINSFLEKCSDEVRLISMLILKCGLSAKQIRSLSLSNLVDKGVDGVYILLRDSGYARMILLPDDVYDFLLAYCTANPPSSSGTVLSNSFGNAYSERSLERIFKKQTDSCGFPYTMPTLRNAAAAYMLAGGATREDVANLLGISQKWNQRFDLCQDKIASFNASSYSVIELKPYGFGR